MSETALSYLIMQDRLHKRCKALDPVRMGQRPLILEFDAAQLDLAVRSCSVVLETDTGLGLAAVVQEMDLHEDCSQELVIFLAGRERPVSFSDPLCGAMPAVTTFANASHAWFGRTRFFSEPATNRLNVSFVRSPEAAAAERKRPSKFSVAVTPTRPNCDSRDASLYLECGGGGQELLSSYCVPKTLACDGVLNCVDPGSGFAFDESLPSCVAKKGIMEFF